jgi:antitoxin CcdA
MRIYNARMRRNRTKDMTQTHDVDAPKRPTNLSVNADLLERARALDINLSATLERALIEALRRQQREDWLRKNRAAIDAYNDEVESRGVFSDGLRSF